jgi:hypothetical protein
VVTQRPIITHTDREAANQMDDMKTLAGDIAELAENEAVMDAIKVLTDAGINGVLYDHLIAQEAFRNPGRHGLRR